MAENQPVSTAVNQLAANVDPNQTRKEETRRERLRKAEQAVCLEVEVTMTLHKLIKIRIAELKKNRPELEESEESEESVTDSESSSSQSEETQRNVFVGEHDRGESSRASPYRPSSREEGRGESGEDRTSEADGQESTGTGTEPEVGSEEPDEGDNQGHMTETEHTLGDSEMQSDPTTPPDSGVELSKWQRQVWHVLSKHFYEADELVDRSQNEHSRSPNDSGDAYGQLQLLRLAETPLTIARMAFLTFENALNEQQKMSSQIVEMLGTAKTVLEECEHVLSSEKSRCENCIRHEGLELCNSGNEPFSK